MIILNYTIVKGFLWPKAKFDPGCEKVCIHDKDGPVKGKCEGSLEITGVSHVFLTACVVPQVRKSKELRSEADAFETVS